ncbi:MULTISPECIES: TonB-dependent receptor [Niastella]|uniref:TonB-dependent receptor plug domain-containing protein n=1 Tax=Niastella soli TaxID=2821487 RepID=A0ABS3YVT8_9BACT|nr:TonB-dependent receptor [Niastella soli]MBO9202025.1 TonB-dependent receptor plug domain-containing protein [Niastella soli]
MRYYITFLLLTMWQALSAQPANLRTSISIPATSLETALKLLEQESHVPISFEGSRIKGIQVKERVYKNVLLGTILKELLEGTQLEYKEKGGNILIVLRPRSGKTLSGFVEDAVSGEKLIGVSLMAPQHMAGTTTNNYGFYSITVPGDSLYIQLTYTGYQRLDTVIKLEGNTHLNFSLQTASRELEQITISAPRTTPIQQSSQMSSINLPVSQVRSMPRLLGEPDLLKTLQQMPGVKQGSEGTSALLVRGGTPDQNLILLDGAPLYNPMHLLGAFSTFNTSVLKDVTLYKGAFPARYGGRLSSVVDISTKDGNMHQLHGDFSVGLLSTQFTLEGPLQKGKTSFVLSARRTYPDLIATPIAKNKPDGPEKFSLFFYDINAKLHHQFSDKDKLYFSFYLGKDKLRLLEQYNVPVDPPVDNYNISDLHIQWGNITSTLRWNHIFSPKLFANTMLIGSSYKLNSTFYSEDKYDTAINTNSLKLNSGIRDFGLKTDFDYRPSPAHTIKMGASYMFRTFTPGIVRMQQTNDHLITLDSLNNNRTINGSETDLYAEDDWEITRWLKLNAGLHWSTFSVQGQFYNSLQPRASARFLLPGNWGLKLSYSRMTQYIHLLANNSISLPTDLWVPATKKIVPQQADQYAVGLARNLFHNKYEFSAEVYYKKMDHVIEYREGADYLTTSKGDTWQEQVAAGTGVAYGAELLLQKKIGRLTGWLGYTWSNSNRTIPEVNYGRTFPYKYDRRHDLHLVLVYKLRKNIELSASWTYQTATPFTVSVANYERIYEPSTANSYYYTQPSINYINSRNNVRVQAYHRLDLGISFIKQKKNGITRTWNISILNVYNRKNPFTYNVKQYSSTNATAQLATSSILPIMPSISYTLTF